MLPGIARTARDPRPPDPLMSNDLRCLRWLTRLHLYNPSTWQAAKADMTRDYYQSVADFNLASWHLLRLPQWTVPGSFAVADPDMMHLIHVDVLRLGRHMAAFPSESKHDPTDCVPGHAELCRRLERILYVLGGLYKATRYVQGFNELLAPIYYVLVFSSDLFDTEDQIEAIAFHCLHALLSTTNLHEMFTTQDNSSLLLRQLRRFERLILRHLPRVGLVIRKLQIHPLCYCFRWFSLLFAQDHRLVDVVKLWDELLDSDDIVESAFYVGLGHLKQMEERLNKPNSGATMRVLQRADECDLTKAMELAAGFWSADREREGGWWVTRVLYRAQWLLGEWWVK